jgi:hypothetical protein
MKFAQFKDAFAHQLTANLQAAVFADPTLRASPGDAIELTLAGYDLDGSLKVGEVTLTAETTPSGVVFKAGDLPRTGAPIPTCELRGKFDSNYVYDLEGLPKPRVIGNGLFCEIAGLIAQPDEGVAEVERILSGTIPAQASPALRAYFAAEESGQPLSIDQLTALARELEALLAMQEGATKKQRIGGDRYLAVLRNGRLEGAPETNEVRPTVGTSLNRMQVQNFTADCTGTPPDSGRGMTLSGLPDGVQMGITFKGCDGDLADGVIYHDSQFIDSTLDYSGKGPIRFASTNTVSGSNLKLGANVDLKREDVRNLICKFPWKAVYHGEEKIYLNCKLRRCWMLDA